MLRMTTNDLETDLRGRPVSPPSKPFTLDQTHGMLAQPGSRIRASSDGRKWRTLFASVQSEMPFEGHFGISRDLLLVLHRTGPAAIESLNGSQAQRRIVPAGGIHIIPADSAFSIRLHAQVETVHIYIRRAVIEDVAIDLVADNPIGVRLPALIVDADPALRALIEASAAALEGENDTAAPFLATYMARAIAAHLVKTYSGMRLRSTAPEDANATATHLVQRAVDFMSRHLDQAISVDDIAQAANSSRSQLARLFHAELGAPPHRHLVKMRVDRAKRLIERTNLPLAEIAFDCGFTHQEHMTRIFRQTFRCTPGAYRRGSR